MKYFNGEQYLNLQEILEMALEGWTQQGNEKCRELLNAYCGIVADYGYGNHFCNYAELNAQGSDQQKIEWLRHTLKYIEGDTVNAAKRIFSKAGIKLVVTERH